MPAKKSGSVNNQRGKQADVIFINWNLSPAQKKELKAAAFTLDWADTQFIRLADEGYKVSLQFDTYNECYSCFITTRDKEHVNAGYILTGRGTTPLKAFKQAVYIGFHIMEGEFARYSTLEGREEIDD